MSDPTEARDPLTPCPHYEIAVYTGPEGAPTLWACANRDCGLRFYPACRTCVDVGHRSGKHEPRS